MTLHHIRIAITLLFVLTTANLAASFAALSAVRDLRQEALLSRQGGVGLLAGESGCSSGVDILSQRSKSLLSAAEQLGKQGVSVGVWRAAAGSGGIAGGVTCK
jgi:hypothetical protein